MNSNAYKVLLALYWCCSRALPLSHSAAAVPQLTKIHCPPLNCRPPAAYSHRRRIFTEEKAKVVAAVWGTEFIQFLAALAVCTRMI